MNTLQRTAEICLCLALCATSGCMVGPKYHQPPATAEAIPASYKESPAQFKGTDGWKVANPQDAMLRGKWWTVFKEPELNALEGQLAINDQNIKQYFENFEAARAIIAQANSQLYPTLTANASLVKSQGAGPFSTPVSSLLSALTLSWEPDLWGKVRNTIHQAQYNAQISAADLENERLSEQTSLAVYYFQIRGQDALQKLYNDTVAADKKTLDYTRSQYAAGVGDQISVVEAQNTLQNAQATATNLGIARAQYEHAIAVLTGRNPSAFSIPVKPMMKVTPPTVPIGVPSQLLERRPDVAAAERTMASANAQIGIAVAAYYPAINLGAEGGYEGSGVNNLFTSSNRLWTIGPSASETIFDAGLRRATVQQFEATYNADIAAYRQTVLTAFRQVEDYLAQVRISSQQIVQQREAEQSAQKYMDLQMARYESGIDPYVNVVTAQNTLLADQEAVVVLQTQQMAAAVQLIESLGGGWDRAQLPSPSQVSKPQAVAETN